MKTQKVRKHSGRYTPRLHSKTMKYSEMKEEVLEPKEDYDSWRHYKDGLKNYPSLDWKKKDKKKEKLKFRKLKKKKK